MTDYGSVSQIKDGGDISNKNLRRPKLDLSFASYGYQSPQQQYRVSPTYSDGGDLISTLMMGGTRSNTPDDSDISNSPESVADLIVLIFYLCSIYELLIFFFCFTFRIKLISIHTVRRLL